MKDSYLAKRHSLAGTSCAQMSRCQLDTNTNVNPIEQGVLATSCGVLDVHEASSPDIQQNV
jgi:hypothetical protein